MANIIHIHTHTSEPSFLRAFFVRSHSIHLFVVLIFSFQALANGQFNVYVLNWLCELFEMRAVVSGRNLLFLFEQRSLKTSMDMI